MSQLHHLNTQVLKQTLTHQPGGPFHGLVLDSPPLCALGQTVAPANEILRAHLAGDVDGGPNTSRRMRIQVLIQSNDFTKFNIRAVNPFQ